MLSQGAGGRPERIALLTAAGLLTAALVFGGGPRGAGDLVVHLFALPALALGILRWRKLEITSFQRAFLYVLLAAIGLSILQLIPLPSTLLEAMQQRAGVLQDLDAAGASTAWLPLTLDRWGSVRVLLALLTFLACWMLASTLSHPSREQLVQLVLVVAFLLALLGFAQAAAGVNSPLRLYDFHHPIGAIGTFANRNHFADLLALLIPFALGMGRATSRRDRAGVGPLLWHGLAVVFLLGAALSYSRTGFALACAVMLAGIAVQWQGKAGPTGASVVTRWGAPIIAVGASVLAIGYYAWQGIVRRLEGDPLDDLRWQYLANGMDVVRGWIPWGSGFGSFRDVYAPFEPVADMGRSFAMHAHNEALEVAIEGGIPALLLLCAALVLVGLAAIGILRNRSTEGHLKLAAAIAVFVPLLHSLVDYPLRTLAIASVFGLVVAMLLAPQQHQPDAQGGR